jgi:hypothetical protein
MLGGCEGAQCPAPKSRALSRQQDQTLAMRMAESIREMFPGCPDDEARSIAAHTSVRGSGRVGRTASGSALDQEGLRAAVVAAVRHKHTKYDHLLMKGFGRMMPETRSTKILIGCLKNGAALVSADTGLD